jgi:hypothetical protein
MLQMIENPMTPPDTKTYLAEALQGLNTMMRWAVRNFGIHEGGQSVVPQTHQLVEKNEQEQQKQKMLAQQPPQPAPNGAMPVNQQPPPTGGIQ